MKDVDVIGCLISTTISEGLNRVCFDRGEKHELKKMCYKKGPFALVKGKTAAGITQINCTKAGVLDFIISLGS
jgi:hypothetical protein